MLATVLALTVAASADEIAIRATFARWKQLAKDTKSLVVGFTLTMKDGATDRITVCDGNLKVLRTDADILARLEIAERGTTEKAEFVLSARKVSILDRATKTMVVLRPESVVRTAAKWIFPPAALLDDAKHNQTYTWAAVTREKWYTHFELKPSDPTSTRVPGRMVIVSRSNDDIPVGLLRQLRQDFPGGKTQTWDFVRWILNGKNPPKVEDFAVPGEKDGWKVTVLEGIWKDEWFQDN
jgi:hypothetical protein